MAVNSNDFSKLFYFKVRKYAVSEIRSFVSMKFFPSFSLSHFPTPHYRSGHAFPLSHFLLFSLLTASLLLFITSCEEPNDLSNNLQPGKSRGNILFTDTLTIQTTTLQADSVFSSHTDLLLAGIYYSSNFGKTSASFYTQVLLPENNYKFPDSARFDSVVLKLEYSTFYGDIDKPMTLNVFEITEELTTDSLYYQYSSKNTGKLLGTKTFAPKFTDSVTEGSTILRPHLRIPLDTSYFSGKLILFNGDSVFTSNAAFVKHFKGIKVAPDSNDESAVISFKTRAVNTSLSFYFTRNGDTLTETFPINELCARFNQYNSERSNSSISKLKDTLPENQSGNKCFLQAGTGVRFKITFPNLEKFKIVDGKKQKFVVNKAELRFFYQKDTLTSATHNTPVPAGLFIYPVDPANKVLPLYPPVQEELYGLSSVTHPLIITTDVTGSYYNAAITRYIQAVLNDEKSNTGFIIQPKAFGVSVNNAVIYGGSYPDLSKRFRLRIFYSVVR